jgi:hypothetical protein
VQVDEVLAVLGDHLQEVLAGLGGSARMRLAELVTRLGEEGDANRRAELADELVTMLRHSLPPGHPVRAAVVAGELRHGAATPVRMDERALGELRATLVGVKQALAPAPDQILEEARQRLLGVPAYTEQELRARGGRLGTGLIRLRRPDGIEVLPAFQFDRQGAPLPVVTEINRVLRADQDPWGVADWWLGRNALLGGVPAQLLRRVPDSALLGAARAVPEDGWDA